MDRKKTYEELRDTSVNFYKKNTYIPINRINSIYGYESCVVNDAYINILPLLSNRNYIYFSILFQKYQLQLIFRGMQKIPAENIITFSVNKTHPENIISFNQKNILSDFTIQEQAFFFANSLPIYCLFETENTKKYYNGVFYLNEKEKRVKIPILFKGRGLLFFSPLLED